MKKITALLCTIFSLSAFAHNTETPCSHTINNESSSHFLKIKNNKGTLIAIEDESQWEIPESNKKTSSNWDLGDQLIITPNSSYFSSYSYTLHNLKTGTSTPANLYYGPRIDGDYTKQVTLIDTVEGEVTLSDGSSWIVSTYDEANLKKWEVYDYVIIGKSNNNNKNILINVNLDKHIEASKYN